MHANFNFAMPNLRVDISNFAFIEKFEVAGVKAGRVVSLLCLKLEISLFALRLALLTAGISLFALGLSLFV